MQKLNFLTPLSVPVTCHLTPSSPSACGSSESSSSPSIRNPNLVINNPMWLRGTTEAVTLITLKNTSTSCLLPPNTTHQVSLRCSCLRTEVSAYLPFPSQFRLLLKCRCLCLLMLLCWFFVFCFLVWCRIWLSFVPFWCLVLVRDYITSSICFLSKQND